MIFDQDFGQRLPHVAGVPEAVQQQDSRPITPAGEANARLTIGKARSSVETIAAKDVGWRECIIAGSFS